MQLAPDWARKREAIGYDGLWFGEAKHNPFHALTLMAEHTQEVRFGVNIAVAFARSPYVMANHAWDLQDYSGGRFVVGLGTQVKGHNERRFSVAWGPPAPRLREYVECMRAIWHTWQTGEKPSYEGKYYRYNLDAWNWNAGPIEHPHIPVLLAAAKRRNTRLAAEVGDGVLWHGMAGFKYRDEVLLPEFEEGARRSGRNPKDLLITGGGYMVTAKNEELLAAAMEEERRWVAFYASTRTYNDSLRAAGFEDEHAHLHRLSIEGKWDEMPGVVTDDMLEAYAAIGTWDEMPARLREKHGGVCTELSFDVDIETPEDEEHVREIVERLKQIPAYGEMQRVPAITEA
jgi:probable F420-dependent oxidoreductase